MEFPTPATDLGDATASERGARRAARAFERLMPIRRPPHAAPSGA
jgi:hypothetical protein